MKKPFLFAFFASFGQLVAIEAVEQPRVAASRTDAFLAIDVRAHCTFLPPVNFQPKLIGKTALSESSEDPLVAISRSNGIVVLTDRASYTFLPDGTFYLRPLGISGRVLDGTWFEQQFDFLDPSTARALTRRFVIVALQTWNNGIVIPNNYRRIVISVSNGVSQPQNFKTEILPSHRLIAPVFDGRIDELEDRPIPSLIHQ